MGGATISIVATIGILVAVVVSLVLYYYRCDLFKAGCDKCKWNIFWTAACPASSSQSPSPSTSVIIPVDPKMKKGNLSIKNTTTNSYYAIQARNGSPGQITTTTNLLDTDKDAQLFNFYPTGETTADGYQTFFIVPGSWCYGSCVPGQTSPASPTWLAGTHYFLVNSYGDLYNYSTTNSTAIGNTEYKFYIDSSSNLKCVGSAAFSIPISIALSTATSPSWAPSQDITTNQIVPGKLFT